MGRSSHHRFKPKNTNHTLWVIWAQHPCDQEVHGPHSCPTSLPHACAFFYQLLFVSNSIRSSSFCHPKITLFESFSLSCGCDEMPAGFLAVMCVVPVSSLCSCFLADCRVLFLKRHGRLRSGRPKSHIPIYVVSHVTMYHIESESGFCVKGIVHLNIKGLPCLLSPVLMECFVAHKNTHKHLQTALKSLKTEISKK